MGSELNPQLLGTGCAGTVAHHCSSSQRACQPLANTSSQRFPSPFCQSSWRWGSSKMVGCWQGSYPGRASSRCAQLCAHYCLFIRSAGLAVCQAAQGGRGRWSRRRSPHLSGHGVTLLHVAGPSGRSAVPAKAGTSPARPPGVSPCLVLTKSSEWDFQYFLWQRSLQPNYLTLTSFLFV